MLKKLFLVAAIACFLSTGVLGQGTQADYERAYGLSKQFAGKVFKNRIAPTWLGGHDFWYENSVRGEREFVLISGASGKRQLFADKESLDKVIIELDIPSDEAPAEQNTGRRRGRNRSGDDVSPNKKWRAFIRDHNVFIHDLEEDEDIPLSHEGNEQQSFDEPFYWSPDSKHVAVMNRKKVETRKVHYVDSAPDDQLQPKTFTRDYGKPGDPMPTQTVHVFETSGNNKRHEADPKLIENPYSTRRLQWRPDSSAVLFEHIERGFGVYRIVEIEIPSGKSRALIDEVSDTFIYVFKKSYRKDLGDGGEILWRSERDGWNHLYLYDGHTGEVKHQITQGEWVVRDVIEVDEKKRQIVFTASGREQGIDPYYIHYYRINFDGGGLVRLTDGDGTHSVQFSPDETVLIDTWSRVDMPPKHALRRVCDGKLVCQLEEADATDLLAARFPVPERFVAKDRDGKFDIHGIICRPTNFDSDKRYPVVEVIYAGPHGSFVPKKWATRYGMWRMELAELGFITVQIDGKGTSNRGREFQHFAYKNIVDSGFPDRIVWMKAAAEKYPQMDISRVGVYGGSAGGQSALGAMLWHGDFYKAAAADCGCHDNRMDKMWWNEQWMDYPIGPHYEQQSNVTNAHRLTGKLFLTVGELDTNVDPSSTFQVVDALIRADKDFDFLMVPGAGHGIAESKYVARRRMDFFVRSLLRVEPREK